MLYLFQGEIHCMDNCPDEPYVFALGGTKKLKVWDIRENSDGMFRLFALLCWNVSKVFLSIATFRFEDIKKYIRANVIL